MTSVYKKLDDQVLKMTLDALNWTPSETWSPLEGDIFCSDVTDEDCKKAWTKDDMKLISALLVVQSTDEITKVKSVEDQLFPTDSTIIKDAFFVLVKNEDSKYALFKDPLPLDNCVICCKQEWDDCFEIQVLVNKESIVLKGECPEQTQVWFKTLQYYSQKLGSWRKRRRALGNIVIDSSLTGFQNDDNSEACSGAGPD